MAEEKGKPKKKNIEDPFRKDKEKKGKIEPGQKAKEKKREELKKVVSKVKAKEDRGELKGEIKPPQPKQPPQMPSGSALPPQQYEERYREDMEPADEGDNPFEEEVKIFEDDEGDKAKKEEKPINPFEPPAPPSKTIEKKALEDKPLDRKEAEAKKEEEKKKKEEKSPEEVKQAKEQAASTVEVRTGEKITQEKVQAKAPEGKTEVPEVVEVKAEPVSGHVAPIETPGAVPKESQVEEFKEDFWDMLEQAGITKKRILYFFIIFVVIVVALILIFSNGDKGEVVYEEPVAEVSEVGEEVVGESSEDFSVVSSYIFGLEYTTEVESPVGSALLVGGPSEFFETKVAYYSDVLRRMENIYNTDVYALLDMSVDRRSALDLHLEEMSDLIVEGEAVYDEIVQAMEDFDVEYELIVEERDRFENEYYVHAESFRGQASYDALESFIALSQDAIRIKAYYNGYKLLRDMFVSSVQALQPRYDDILSNKEALIKGIRVFDIPASDIEAIIPVPEE